MFFWVSLRILLNNPGLTIVTIIKFHNKGMSSKGYFTIAGVFIVIYIIASFAVISGLPDWLHKVATVIFAGAILLGLRAKKKEKAEAAE